MKLGSQTAFNGYALMWLYVMFDLPVETKAQRREATRFRKDLLKDGFTMHQFSVYIRHCASNEAAAGRACSAAQAQPSPDRTC